MRINRGAFAKPGTSLEFHTGNWRNQRPDYLTRPAPCQQACPAGEPIRDYLALVAREEYRAAWEMLAQANPLPAITGRVCHHPCEGGCNRGQVDEALAVHSIERFLGDQALQQGWDYPSIAAKQLTGSIAVVGAGPAGLSAAYHAAQLGLNVSLFDAAPLAGGLLRSAIPPYRLPRDVVDRELEKLLAIKGITFYPEHTLGRDIHLDELRQQFTATFLGVGTGAASDWQIDGAQPDDLHQGLTLLQECINLQAVPPWQRVAVVGAGNTAIDLARMLLRSGVSEVHVISHKAIPTEAVPAADRMPALPREVEQALEEGVMIHQHQMVQRLILRGGLVTGVELVKAKKLDYDGTLKRTTFEGTETVLDVDQVIPAIGQHVGREGLESLLNGKPFLSADYWGCIAGSEALYVGGDARGDHGMVSEAIGDGRRAIEHIQRVLQQQSPAQEPIAAVTVDELNLHYFLPESRVEVTCQSVQTRLQSHDEIEAGLPPQLAHRESLRCFSCGDCLQCDNCWNYCPDAAVLVEDNADNRQYVFDYEYCKGCGLCANECPSGHIVMRDEN